MIVERAGRVVPGRGERRSRRHCPPGERAAPDCPAQAPPRGRPGRGCWPRTRASQGRPCRAPSRSSARACRANPRRSRRSGRARGGCGPGGHPPPVKGSREPGPRDECRVVAPDAAAATTRARCAKPCATGGAKRWPACRRRAPGRESPPGAPRSRGARPRPKGPRPPATRSTDPIRLGRASPASGQVCARCPEYASTQPSAPAPVTPKPRAWKRPSPPAKSGAGEGWWRARACRGTRAGPRIRQGWPHAPP